MHHVNSSARGICMVLLRELQGSNELSLGRTNVREGCTEEEVCELHLEARGRFHQVPNWENRAWSWEKILCIGIGICKVMLT